MILIAQVTKCAPPFRTAVEGALCARPAGTPKRMFGDAGFVTAIAELLVFVAGAVAVIMLLYSGILFALSRGEDRKVERAKRTALFALMGLIVALLSYAIVRFVLVTLLG